MDRPVRHFLQQRSSVIAPVEVIVVCCFRRDLVVAELYVLRRGGVTLGLLKMKRTPKCTRRVGSSTSLNASFSAVGSISTTLSGP